MLSARIFAQLGLGDGVDPILLSRIPIVWL